jgi:Flp pilus assembly protein TadG
MNNPNMKKAVIDQILLWIVLFTIFVSLLFFLIDYSSALKIKDNSDAVADYIARMYAQNKDESDIVIGANNIKGSYFASISNGDLNCSINSAISNNQVIVNVYATLVNNFLPLADNNIHSKAVVFNESSDFQKECSLTLLFN